MYMQYIETPLSSWQYPTNEINYDLFDIGNAEKLLYYGIS